MTLNDCTLSGDTDEGTTDSYITEYDGSLENGTTNGHHFYVNVEHVI